MSKVDKKIKTETTETIQSPDDVKGQSSEDVQDKSLEDAQGQSSEDVKGQGPEDAQDQSSYDVMPGQLHVVDGDKYQEIIVSIASTDAGPAMVTDSHISTDTEEVIVMTSDEATMLTSQYFVDQKGEDVEMYSVEEEVVTEPTQEEGEAESQILVIEQENGEIIIIQKSDEDENSTADNKTDDVSDPRRILASTEVAGQVMNILQDTRKPVRMANKQMPGKIMTPVTVNSDNIVTTKSDNDEQRTIIIRIKGNDESKDKVIMRPRRSERGSRTEEELEEPEDHLIVDVKYPDNANNKPVRPIERQKMRPWLIELLDKNCIPGLSWQNKRERIFRISWKHAAHNCFNKDRDSDLFERWAIHTGRHSEGNHKRWKANFRCALNSLPDVIELRDLGVRKGDNAFKVYKFLDTNDPAYKDRMENKGKKSSSTSNVKLYNYIGEKSKNESDSKTTQKVETKVKVVPCEVKGQVDEGGTLQTLLQAIELQTEQHDTKSPLKRSASDSCTESGGKRVKQDGDLYLQSGLSGNFVLKMDKSAGSSQRVMAVGSTTTLSAPTTPQPGQATQNDSDSSSISVLPLKFPYLGTVEPHTGKITIVKLQKGADLNKLPDDKVVTITTNETSNLSEEESSQVVDKPVDSSGQSVNTIGQIVNTIGQSVNTTGQLNKTTNPTLHSLSQGGNQIGNQAAQGQGGKQNSSIPVKLITEAATTNVTGSSVAPGTSPPITINSVLSGGAPVFLGSRTPIILGSAAGVLPGQSPTKDPSQQKITFSLPRSDADKGQGQTSLITGQGQTSLITGQGHSSLITGQGQTSLITGQGQTSLITGQGHEQKITIPLSQIANVMAQKAQGQKCGITINFENKTSDVSSAQPVYGKSSGSQGMTSGGTVVTPNVDTSQRSEGITINVPSTVLEAMMLQGTGESNKPISIASAGQQVNAVPASRPVSTALASQPVSASSSTQTVSAALASQFITVVSSGQLNVLSVNPPLNSSPTQHVVNSHLSTLTTASKTTPAPSRPLRQLQPQGTNKSPAVVANLTPLRPLEQQGIKQQVTRLLISGASTALQQPAKDSTASTEQPLQVSTTSQPLQKTATPQPLKTTPTPQPLQATATQQPLQTTATPQTLQMTATPQPLQTTATSQPLQYTRVDNTMTLGCVRPIDNLTTQHFIPLATNKDPTATGNSTEEGKFNITKVSMPTSSATPKIVSPMPLFMEQVTIDLREIQQDGKPEDKTTTTQQYSYSCLWCKIDFNKKIDLLQHFMKFHQDMLMVPGEGESAPSPAQEEEQETEEVCNIPTTTDNSESPKRAKTVKVLLNRKRKNGGKLSETDAAEITKTKKRKKGSFKSEKQKKSKSGKQSKTKGKKKKVPCNTSSGQASPTDSQKAKYSLTSLIEALRDSIEKDKGDTDTEEKTLTYNNLSSDSEVSDDAAQLAGDIHVSVTTFTVDGKTMYKCSVCQKVFSKTCTFARHAMVHSKMYPYQCGLCDEKCSDMRVLLRHLDWHGEDVDCPCERCEKLHHSEGGQEGGDLSVQCEVCQEEFTCNRALSKHRKSQHSMQVCPFCLETCTFDMASHMSEHKGIYMYRCGLCGEGYNSRPLLHEHLKIHTHMGKDDDDDQDTEQSVETPIKSSTKNKLKKSESETQDKESIVEMPTKSVTRNKNKKQESETHTKEASAKTPMKTPSRNRIKKTEQEANTSQSTAENPVKLSAKNKKPAMEAQSMDLSHETPTKSPGKNKTKKSAKINSKSVEQTEEKQDEQKSLEQGVDDKEENSVSSSKKVLPQRQTKRRCRWHDNDSVCERCDESFVKKIAFGRKPKSKQDLQEEMQKDEEDVISKDDKEEKST